MGTHRFGCKWKGYWRTMNFLQLGISIAIFSLLFAGNGATANNANEHEETSAQGEEAIPSISDYRLPNTIIPTSYEIILTPRLEDNFDFNGTVHIQIHIQKATDVITLHHGQITIKKTTVTSLTCLQDQREILGTAYNNNTEKYEIKLKEVLPKGMNFTLSIYYSGKLRDDMIGFYRSSYFDSNGNIRWLAATHFQTTHARHAFPCFDEPSFKATFLIRILRKREHSCLSNMPLKATIKSNEGTLWDEFEQSIPMSTYLVAFIVSDFICLQEGIFKVWTRPNAIQQAVYPLGVGPRALDQLSKWFQQDYQISKMDMVAVPDFSIGAMENWGLVAYRESRLLYQGNTTSDAAKQRIASTIVHELTHMWFGNMVTPEWWSYLWLSEAFATYFEYFGTARIENSWNMEDQFLVEQHQAALAADGIETSQPMTRNVSSSTQMRGIADTITYSKGASIVRMMNLIFGQDIFQRGLQNYLENNKGNKVARPENLWVEFQNELNPRNKQFAAPVSNIMSTWTTQAGYPVLNVFIQNGVVTVRQKRFLLRNLKSTPTNTTWWIPITWTSNYLPRSNAVNTTYWLSKEQKTIHLGKVRRDFPEEWTIFNVQAAGFYRVTYDNASWYRIINALNSKNYQDIHLLNRAALVDDLLNLARADLIDYKTALDGLQYIRQEKNYLPFKSAFSGLLYLDQRFCGHPESYELFKKFVLKLIENRYDAIGYFDNPNDERLKVLLRSELNKWACNYGHEGCVNTFTKMFQRWRKNNSLIIEPNQKAVAYCTGIRYGTKNDWEFLWGQYFNSNSATEQAVILQALGCTQDASILERYLLYSLDSFETSRIRRQDNNAVFSAVHSTGISGAEVVLNFVAKHHGKMSAYYNGTDTIASILSSASQRFSTQGLVDKFEKLIETQAEFKGIAEALRDSLEIANYELRRFDEFRGPIISWITAFLDEHVKLPDYYLSKSIVPKAYWISLRPQINETSNFIFDGNVTITAKVIETTKTIVLHSAEIIHHKVLVFRGGREMPNATIDTNAKFNFLTIELEQPLLAQDEITVKIQYTGYLNEEIHGFYRTWYKDGYGKIRWLAATHLEPIGARKMFPCLDEPALKATFAIEVTVQAEYNAISNMPCESVIIHKNGEKTIIFQETPKMSTYLVALVVSDFTSVQMFNKSHEVWARPNAMSHTKYALFAMDGLLTFYEDLLGLPYQLPKLDMVALPDFAPGAMENWGLLTYKEGNLLYDSKDATDAQKQSITTTIAHEIAYQWFGNLVSPKWWKYLWLKEGFATYFQYFVTYFMNLSWHLDIQFVVDQLHSALEADSSTSSHPLTHDVHSPTEIRAIFDPISHAKGASVLRMLEKSVGQRVFYQALQKYLQKHQYGVATPEDLFDAFKETIRDTETRNSIHEIMNTWTTQAGYPIVHVRVQNNTMHLRQERFLMKQKTDAFAKSTWYIPITWEPLTGSNVTNTTPRYWLKDAENSIKIPESDKGYLIVNTQQAGFYRTNYDDRTWQGIIDFLKTGQYKAVDEVNRAAIIDDLMNFGRAGYVDYDTVLSATQYLANETAYGPWRAFFNNLNYLRGQFQGADVYDAYKQYVTGILKPIYDRYGYVDNVTDFYITKLLRSHIRKWACELEISDCVLQAIRYLPRGNTSIIDKNIPPNKRSTPYCTAVRMWPNRYWKDLWYLYLMSTVATEKAIILESLACTRNKILLNEFLEYAINKDSGLRFEDSPGVFFSVMNANLEGVETILDFIKINYDRMVTYYRGVFEIKSILSVLGKKLSTDELYRKYMDLMDWLDKADLSLQSSLKSYKTAAEEELNWVEKYTPKIHEWFEINYPHKNYRLPLLFSPLKYNVSLSPYFEKGGFTFNGSVQIGMKRLQGRVSRIVLNAHELQIKGVSVYNSNSNLEKGEKLEVSRYLENEQMQTLSIFLKNFIKSDYVIVDIEFAGYLNDEMKGFYRSYYLDDEKNIRWLAATRFKPTHARSTFPCLDEPALKAKFTINIERPDDYIALSNMPSAKSFPSSVPGRTWETFEESAEMSSYLVAFVVCDFKTVGNVSGKVNVWGRSNVAENDELAENAATRMLELLFEETGQEYVLPKLDLIGIPDFAMDAVENWGLATFRQDGLFYDQNATSAKYTDYTVTVIAHELSHMWYGNLVTCKWWEYVWLNEGFAEYMQWRIADMFLPSHDFDDLFVVDKLQLAMQNDDYFSTHPMNNHVDEPSEIAKTFDTIAYGKSSSVIRMIHNSMDPEIFPKAMHKYLSQNRYNSTTPKELWKAFDDTIKESNGSGKWISMENLMNSWTNERGYPVVTANLIYNTLTLKQKRFSYNIWKHPPNVYFWIPITIASATKPNFNTTWTNLWLGPETLQIPVENPNKWFLLNVRQSGYYRVIYDRNSWYRLFDALKQPSHSNIHVTNRAQIIDDLLSFSRSNDVPQGKAFDGTTYLLTEEEYLPWKAFFNGMSFIAQRFEGQADRDKLRKYILYLTSMQFKRLGFMDSTKNKHQDQLLRELILSWVCKYDGTQCVDTSMKLFAAWRRDLANVISPNARPTVYCTALRHGSEDDWNFLWQRYLETNFLSEKKTILNALGCTRSKNLLNQYMQYVLTRNYTSDIRKQDVITALASVYNNGHFGVEVMMDFLLENYRKVYEYYGNWDSVGQLFLKVTSRVSTQEQIRKYNEFLSTEGEELQSILSTLATGLDTAETNYEWYIHSRAKIVRWLDMFLSKVPPDGRSAAQSLNIVVVIVITLAVCALVCAPTLGMLYKYYMKRRRHKADLVHSPGTLPRALTSPAVHEGHSL